MNPSEPVLHSRTNSSHHFCFHDHLRLTSSYWVCVLVICSFQLPHLAFGEDKVVRFKAKPGSIENPMKGWCPYPDAGPIHQPYSMVFQYVSWKELEPEKGIYRFDEWEQKWNSAAAKGKHVIFRVYIDYPTKPLGLPDWLIKAGVKVTPYSDYGGGQSPDYDDPRMIEGMEKLISALGKRYNSHPRVAFIQLGLLGFWGEWHTYPQTKLYASAETEQRIIYAYKKAFPDKSLMVRYARGYAGKQEWIGFHDDMFPEDTDNGQDWSFLAGLRKTKRVGNWKKAVVGGEMVPNQAKKWLGGEIVITRQMIEKAHFTWVGPYCPALARSTQPEFSRRSQELVRMMGYNFRLENIAFPNDWKVKQSTKIQLQGENLGVAPFYYPWSVDFVLLNKKGKVVSRHRTGWDIRQWQPGDFQETTDIKWEVAAGEYDLAVGVIDPWKKTPAIEFANDLKQVAGWTILGKVKLRQK